ncbi:MAG TPA: TolC family protein [Ohtaekwangia sp.]
MRKVILVALINLAWSGALLGQSVDYNKIILPSSVKDASVEERLVQIAWANMPQNSIIQRQTTIAHNNLRKAQWSWLDHIFITGNLNEFTISGNPDGTSNNFYPRYNFGISFTLGAFAMHSLNVKNAREDLKIREESTNEQKLFVRAEVLKRYSTYKSNQELLRVQSKLLLAAESNFKLQEKKFQTGEITVEIFNGSEERYNNQLLRKVQAENNFQHSKLDLEQMLGLKLEEIL